MNTSDGELLRCYASECSETAFAELVRRHINLVYSAALRQVNGDAQGAEDVTQAVFTDLAAKAARLCRHPSLTGWLYTSTRYLAANHLRTERRRQAREFQAHAMNILLSSSSDSETDWTQLRPVIDDAMHLLNEQDREAVLLRHFENRSYAEIASDLGLTENAARMRVERALEKLRTVLTKRGMGSTLAVLAALLAANAVTAAPVGLSAKVVGASLAGAAAAGGASTFLPWLAASKPKLAAAAAIVATVAVTTIAIRHAVSQTQKVIPTVLASAAAPPSAATSPNGEGQPADAGLSAAAVPPVNGPALHLQIVDAGTGNPIPLTPLDCVEFTDGVRQASALISDRYGVCDVAYPAGTTELGIITRKEYYADTQLLWQPDHGDVIPTNYVLKLQRSVPIGGRVVDSADNPVADATVTWIPIDYLSRVTYPESHEFGNIKAITDQDGHWRINHLADDVIERIRGEAFTSNLTSAAITISRNKSSEQDLRAGNLVLVLQPRSGITVRGLVTDTNGTPITGVRVFVGIHPVGNRGDTTWSDGTFTLTAGRLGPSAVSAEAPGYATTTVTADLNSNTAPIHLVLHPGKTLRLAVKDVAGNPISNALVSLRNQPQAGPIRLAAEFQALAEFQARADSDGRVVWTNAPDGPLYFAVTAPGYFGVNHALAQADGHEYIITLAAALTIHGTVTDETSGQPVSPIRVTIGWQEVTLRGTTNYQWRSLDRFSGGAYSHTVDKPPVTGMEIQGYVLKFTADGYAPFVSRAIATNEGNVELDVTLHRAASTTVTVFQPDNQPSAGDDVGFVTRDGNLRLKGTGLVAYDPNVPPIVHTAENGTFELPPDDSITRVIIAGQDGFADVDPSQLTGNAKIYLQPWGNLEVACADADGQPIVARTYRVLFGDSNDRGVVFDMGTTDAQTDAHGEFTISNLPPGTRELARTYIRTEGESISMTFGERMPIEIKPGDTTTLNLGASNYVVTAHLQWPAGVQRQLQWHLNALLQPTLRNQAGARSLPADINSDGTFNVDDVRPGKYQLSVTVSEPPPSTPGSTLYWKSLFHGAVLFTAPSDPATGKMDAGVITLQAAPIQR